MSTYFDKKKLLEDNKDLYISEFDKSLDIGSLSGIIEAKREYTNAESKSDKNAMANANKKANNIRMASGNYSGGTDGSEYIKPFTSYESKRPSAYKSAYESDRKKVLSSIARFGDFSYNPETDPVFRSYRSLYSKLGNEAYDRALAKGALRTGGTVNSGAQSAAMQAKNNYNTMLMQKIPQLYDSAYKRYTDKYNSLYKLLNSINENDSTAYNRYRDTVKDFESDRDYYYTKDKDYMQNISDRYKYETDIESGRYEFDTKNETDRYEFDTKNATDIYKFDKGAEADRYEFDTKNATDRYKIDTENATDIYKFDKGAEADRYEFDTKNATDRYKIDTENATDIYKFDKGAEADRYEFDETLKYNRERDANNNEIEKEKIDTTKRDNVLDAAIALAKALYGKVPVSQWTVQNLIQMLE